MVNVTVRALTVVNFSYLPHTKYKFLPDEAKKTMAYYTFAVRPTNPESDNLKIAMKKFDEEENEDFFKKKFSFFEKISALKILFSAKKKQFERICALDCVSFTELKIDFRKFSLSQNLENFGS